MEPFFNSKLGDSHMPSNTLFPRHKYIIMKVVISMGKRILTREEWEQQKRESRIKLIETLKGLEFYHEEEDLRRLYNNNPRFQHESFEAFALRVLTIKKMVDNMKRYSWC